MKVSCVAIIKHVCNVNFMFNNGPSSVTFAQERAAF